MKKSTIIVLVIVVLVIIYGLVSYNSFVSLGAGVDSQWAQVETQYQRRFDLIPNLVSSVKGIMSQEQKVFSDLAEARTKYSGAKTTDEKVAATDQVESSLSRLLMVVENYPQLKSSDNVTTLMAQLEGTENRISVERKKFNDAVQAYDIKTATFPSNMIAKIFGFKERAYFKSVDQASQAPQVKLTE